MYYYYVNNHEIRQEFPLCKVRNTNKNLNAAVPSVFNIYVLDAAICTSRGAQVYSIRVFRTPIPYLGLPPSPSQIHLRSSV